MHFMNDNLGSIWKRIISSRSNQRFRLQNPKMQRFQPQDVLVAFFWARGRETGHMTLRLGELAISRQTVSINMQLRGVSRPLRHQNPPPNSFIVNIYGGFGSAPGYHKGVRCLQVESTKSRPAGALRSDDWGVWIILHREDGKATQQMTPWWWIRGHT